MTLKKREKFLSSTQAQPTKRMFLILFILLVNMYHYLEATTSFTGDMGFLIDSLSLFDDEGEGTKPSLLFSVPFASTYGLSIKRNAIGKGERREKTVNFDEFGTLPEIEAVYKSIRELSSPIVSIRTKNCTIIAFRQPKITSSISVSSDMSPLNSLLNPYQCMLMTGRQADCRSVLKHARQLVLNHTVEYDRPPMGRLVAIKLGQFLQRATMSSAKRPLICHFFIIDSRANGTIHEVDAAGSVAEVYGGMAGRGMVEGKLIIEEHFDVNMSVTDAQILAVKAINGRDRTSSHHHKRSNNITETLDKNENEDANITNSENENITLASEEMILNKEKDSEPIFEIVDGKFRWNKKLKSNNNTTMSNKITTNLISHFLVWDKDAP